ncbi:MAG: M20 family metallopeptidase [Lachnospiraceae bacterium]
MGVQYITQDIYDYMVEMRRWFHCHPELSWQEENTARRIAQELESMHIDCRMVCDTAVLGFLPGQDSTKTIGLRADMDALAVKEETGLSYSSKQDGVMHACGHDFHMAMLLGAARYLAANRECLRCNVLFIFQPAEEWISDSGAAHLMELDEVNHLTEITGIHIWNDLPVGTACVQPGVLMASADTFDLVIKGKGGHGATPQYTVDPIVIGSQFVSQLQTLVSRESSPLEPLVISVCTFQAGSTENVIPGRAVLKGTVRTTSETMRAGIADRMERLLQGICYANRAEYEWNYHVGTLLVDNEEDLTVKARDIFKDMLGTENLHDLPVQMIGEDFSKYQKEIPGIFVLLGGNDGKHQAPHHSGCFVQSEDAMRYGAEYFVRYVL